MVPATQPEVVTALAGVGLLAILGGLVHWYGPLWAGALVVAGVAYVAFDIAFEDASF
jgi:protein-S-isoprenylcysteine O-methyltransferase Ste14